MYLLLFLLKGEYWILITALSIFSIHSFRDGVACGLYQFWVVNPKLCSKQPIRTTYLELYMIRIGHSLTWLTKSSKCAIGITSNKINSITYIMGLVKLSIKWHKKISKMEIKGERGGKGWTLDPLIGCYGVLDVGYPRKYTSTSKTPLSRFALRDQRAAFKRPMRVPVCANRLKVC